MRAFSTLALAALLGAFTSNASPFAKRRPVSETLLADMKLMSQYASAAYCKPNIDSPGGTVYCGSGKCPLVQAANVESLEEYSEAETSTDVTGYIAADHTHKLLIVAFRGSRTPDNWITNFDFAMMPTTLCPKCVAHSGFWRSWTDARRRVVSALKNSTAQYPGYQIRVTGHSLGGAVATFAAAGLRTEGFDVAMYTFGAPRIGGPSVSDFISKQAGGNYRITHWNDPVSRIPFLTMGYVHVTPEYYIDVKNKQEVRTSDIKVLDGSWNLKGNAKWLAMDPEAHMWFFHHLNVCGGKKSKRRGALAEDMHVIARF
ncbi:hypothetical protein ACJQWK_10556 [Exserohilum turcicum]|uniref:Alpha/beta-hydrolase n=1 Tax=Exserohilum turcicum (strain 28A) TaxID=671987 RepID=R0I6X1_EXST2|nr:uncharacterized protein SETTUDRAFT_122961 [Exserohilum turcica Et28A]EOA81330.1 hypothetical protein SETTUDRAFT_122961 [Exserohilum turcica Et28A]